MRAIMFILLSALFAASPTMAQGDKEPAVTLVQLNVRECPSASCTKLGTLPAGQKFYVDEVADGWAKFQYWGRTAYVSAAPEHVRLSDALSLPSGDTYRVVSYAFDPPQPVPGRAFRLLLTVESRIDLDTSVGVVWGTGALTMIPASFRAGIPQQLVIEGTDTATGPREATAMIDIEMKQPPQPDAKIPLTYFVDRAATRSSLTMRASTNFDIDGGLADFALAGDTITALGKAQVGETDTTWASIHYDMITPTLASVPFVPNMPILALTGEGRRAALRITSIDGNIYIVEFKVYD